MNQEFRIIALIAIAFIIGLGVLILKPDYRIADNIASNSDYYPGSTLNTPTPEIPDEGTPTQSKFDSTVEEPLIDADEQTTKDFEF